MARPQLWKEWHRSTSSSRVAGDGAAFARRQVLRVLEAEAAEVAQRAALPAPVLGQPRLAGVLDHGEIVLLRDRVDGVHVARHAVDVHGHDGARAVGDPALDGGRVHRQRLRIGVGEHRQRLAQQDRVVRRDERERRHDDLVAGVDVHDVQGHLQRRRAARGGQAPLRAEQLGVGGFELVHRLARPAVPTAAAQHVEDCRFPGLAPGGPPGPTAGVHGRPAEQGRHVGIGGGVDAWRTAPREPAKGDGSGGSLLEESTAREFGRHASPLFRCGTRAERWTACLASPRFRVDAGLRLPGRASQGAMIGVQWSASPATRLPRACAGLRGDWSSGAAWPVQWRR